MAEDDSQEQANELLARAACYLPGLADAEAIPVPVGWRPMPVDGYPTMGLHRRNTELVHRADPQRSYPRARVEPAGGSGNL